MLRKILISFCLLSSVFIAFGKNDKDKQGTQNAPLYFINAEGKKIFYNEIGAPLPELKIWRSDGVFLTDNDLKNDANLILMLFNPTCEHCEEMGRMLRDNIGLFKQSNLVLVAAPGMGSYLDYFINTTQTETTEKMQIGVDSSGLINQTFLYKSLPQINIYNKERKLEKIFFGIVPVDSLKGYIE